MFARITVTTEVYPLRAEVARMEGELIVAHAEIARLSAALRDSLRDNSPL